MLMLAIVPNSEEAMSTLVRRHREGLHPQVLAMVLGTEEQWFLPPELTLPSWKEPRSTQKAHRD